MFNVYVFYIPLDKMFPLGVYNLPGCEHRQCTTPGKYQNGAFGSFPLGVATIAMGTFVF